jgi:hypothetical protein
MSPFRPRRSAALLAAFLGWSLPLACGKSDSRNGNLPTGTGGDTAATGGSGGGAAQGGSTGSGDSCSYNGKRYENGETFGTCDECICAEGGIFCTNVACATGGSGGTSGAPVGGAGSGAGGTQGGMGDSSGTGGGGGTGLIADGGSFPVAGMGGTAGSGATAGMENAGGEAGFPGEDCENQLFTKFCVLGVPDGDRMNLDEGVDISIAMYPAGCSCSRVTQANCYPLNGTNDVMVTTGVCVAPVGGDCTEQCREDQIATCAVWSDLSEGTWKVSIPRSGLEVTFQVPSSVPADRLCAKVM